MAKKKVNPRKQKRAWRRATASLIEICTDVNDSTNLNHLEPHILRLIVDNARRIEELEDRVKQLEKK